MFWNGWQKAAQRERKISVKNRTYKTRYTFALLERIRRQTLSKILGTQEEEAVNDGTQDVSQGQ